MVPIGRCYRHGGNCFNLRAKLEDMIEIERRRAGKDLDRAGDPMTLSDGQRIFFAAIQVMRILGWAWRWAEVCRLCRYSVCISISVNLVSFASFDVVVVG